MRVLVVLGFCLLAATADKGRKPRSIWPFNKYFSDTSLPEITIPGYKFISAPKSNYASLYGYGADLSKKYPIYTGFSEFDDDSRKSYFSQRFDFPSTYTGKTTYAINNLGSTYNWPYERYLPYNLRSSVMNPWALGYETSLNSHPYYYNYAPYTGTSNGFASKSSYDLVKNDLLSKKTGLKSEAYGFENMADVGLKKDTVESGIEIKNIESKTPSLPAVGYGYTIDLQSSSGPTGLKTPVPIQEFELKEPVLSSVDASYGTNIELDLKENSKSIGSSLPATGYGYIIDLQSSKELLDVKTPAPMQRVELKVPELSPVDQSYTINIEPNLKENIASKISTVPAVGYGYTIDLQSSGILPDLKLRKPVEQVELKAPVLSFVGESYPKKSNVEIPEEKPDNLELKTPELPILGTGYTIDIGSAGSTPNSGKLLVESPDLSNTRMGYRVEETAKVKIGMSYPRDKYYNDRPLWPTYGSRYNYYLQASDYMPYMPYGEMKNDLHTYGLKTLSDETKEYFTNEDDHNRLATKNENIEIKKVNSLKAALPAYGSGYTIDLSSDGNLPITDNVKSIEEISYRPRVAPVYEYGYFNNPAVSKPEEVQMDYDKYKAGQMPTLGAGYSIDIKASSKPVIPELPTTILNNDHKYLIENNPYEQKSVDITSRGDISASMEPVEEKSEYMTAKLPDFGSGYTIDLSSNEKTLYKPNDNIAYQAPAIDKSDLGYSSGMEISNEPEISQAYKTGKLPEFGSGYSIDLHSDGGLQKYDAPRTGEYIHSKSYKPPSYGNGYQIDINSAGKMPYFEQNYLKSSYIPMLGQGYSIDLSSEHMTKTPIKENKIYSNTLLPSADLGYYLNMDSRQGFEGLHPNYGLSFGRYGGMKMQAEPSVLCRNHCEQIVTFRGKTLRTPYRGYMNY